MIEYTHISSHLSFNVLIWNIYRFSLPGGAPKSFSSRWNRHEDKILTLYIQLEKSFYYASTPGLNRVVMTSSFVKEYPYKQRQHMCLLCSPKSLFMMEFLKAINTLLAGVLAFDCTCNIFEPVCNEVWRAVSAQINAMTLFTKISDSTISWDVLKSCTLSQIDHVVLNEKACQICFLLTFKSSEHVLAG